MKPSTRVALAVVYVLLGYFAVASSVWQMRNPKANHMTTFTHFADAMAMRKLPEFQ